MKRLCLIFLLLGLTISQAILSAEERTSSIRPVYGLEWGSDFNFHSSRYSLYVTEDQFLVEDSQNGFTSHLNGMLDAFAGVGLPYSEVTLSFGYAGIDKNLRLLPIGLKISYFLDKERVDGFYFYAKESIGIPIQKFQKSSQTTGIGLGYRIDLNGYHNLNYSIAFNGTHFHPLDIDDPYSGEKVRYESIRKSNGWNLSLCFCIGLNF